MFERWIVQRAMSWEVGRKRVWLPENVGEIFADVKFELFLFE